MTERSGDLSLAVSLGDASFSATGSTAVVLDAYEDFKQLISSAEPRPSQAPTQASKESSASQAPSSSATDTVTELPLRPFVNELNLKGNKEKATAVVAWAEASGTHESMNLAQIEESWKKTPFRSPKNLARDVRNAESQGWLDRDGKPGSPEATYRVTGYGKQTLQGWKESSSS